MVRSPCGAGQPFLLEGLIAPGICWILTAFAHGLLHLTLETLVSYVWRKIMTLTARAQPLLRLSAEFLKKLMLHSMTAAIIII